MDQYTEEERNLVRKNLLCSIENNFNTTKQTINNDNITNIDYNNMTCNISLYKLATENLLMHKKLNAIENEVKELKKTIDDFKQ
uniref:Uncharacterized protein n=1 Tax=viral metagenome TaxID=1070528 RepID=A0A6C0AX06_9ZZZZ|tara:strand:- start:1825 stop:2076 length:252 start_codon:yes stop_codon:yes gene_type:complete